MMSILVRLQAIKNPLRVLVETKLLSVVCL